MRIPVSNFNTFCEKKHIPPELVDFGISQFATDSPLENFLVHSLIPCMVVW